MKNPFKDDLCCGCTVHPSWELVAYGFAIIFYKLLAKQKTMLG